MKHALLTLALAALVLPTAAGTPQENLQTAVTNRFLGDRTGACLAVALVGPGTDPVTAFVCADPTRPRALDEHTAFEIGSVARTMTSALLAELVLKGEVSLDDPLAKLLPKGTKVPDFQGQPITLRHVLANRSGLPALPGRMRPGTEANPYASLAPAELLGSLEDVKLEAAPGSQYRASSFAMMLLSYGLAQHSGLDGQALLARDLFQPLAMDDAHAAGKGVGAHEAQGHASNGRPASAWSVPADLAGAGGVRASLADLIHYVEGELDLRKSALNPALKLTQGTLEASSGPAMAWGWAVVPLGDRDLLLHEGATGGFSSLVVLDPTNHQGVVLLSDTSLANLGGLAPLGLSLLDPAAPPAGFPRRAATPGELVLTRMVGRFALPEGRKLFIEKKDGKLFAQTEGEPSLELAYDSTGDFYALDQDLVLHPLRNAKNFSVILRQGGGQVKAERIVVEELDAKALQPFLGHYKGAGGFSVKVFARGVQLVVQTSTQPETLVEAIDKDVFGSEATSAEYIFARNAAGKVISLSMRQNGVTVKAEKR